MDMDPSFVVVPFMCVGGLLAIALFAFWLWMLIDCVQREFEGNNKVIWILVIVLAGWIGAIIY